jgi:hypothetical protein
MNKYPKIGIRPTIDGRQGGVREALEEKTMALAHAVADLISSNLRNGDGSPVECVISNTTIGRVAEAAACEEQFERAGVENVDERIAEFTESGQMPAVRESIRRTKAVKWLVENATVTEVDEIAEARAKADSE